MKNILSIDLDFLFPQLDDFMEIQREKNDTPNVYWNRMSKKYNKDLYNLKPYFKASDLITQILSIIRNNNLSSNIRLLEKHQEILDFINEEVSIINIDQHHDIYYSFLDKNAVSISIENENIKNFESNWVYYLYCKGLLNSYTWVGNYNSSYTLEHLRFPFSFYIPEEEIEYVNIYGISYKLEDDLKANKFDEIVFVISPYYTPINKYVEKIVTDIKSLI